MARNGHVDICKRLYRMLIPTMENLVRPACVLLPKRLRTISVNVLDPILEISTTTSSNWTPPVIFARVSRWTTFPLSIPISMPTQVLLDSWIAWVSTTPWRRASWHPIYVRLSNIMQDQRAVRWNLSRLELPMLRLSFLHQLRPQHPNRARLLRRSAKPTPIAVLGFNVRSRSSTDQSTAQLPTLGRDKALPELVSEERPDGRELESLKDHDHLILHSLSLHMRCLFLPRQKAPGGINVLSCLTRSLHWATTVH